MAEETGLTTAPITIDDEDQVMRWVNKFGVEKRADGSFKKLRPGAFPLLPSHARGFSVWLRRLMSIEVCKQKASEAKGEQIGLVILTAKDFRDFGLDVEQVPEHDETAHCEVTNYQGKSETELTDIKREWIRRTQNTFTALDR